MNKLLKNLFIFFIVVFAASQATASEPTEDERIAKAIQQIITSLLIKYELDSDINCQTKKYADFNLNEFVDSFPKINMLESEKSKMIKTIKDAADKIKITKPQNSDKTISQITYLGMKDAFIKANAQIGNGANYCDQLYTAAGNIFQKSKDNLKLMK